MRQSSLRHLADTLYQLINLNMLVDNNKNISSNNDNFLSYLCNALITSEYWF